VGMKDPPEKREDAKPLSGLQAALARRPWSEGLLSWRRGLENHGHGSNSKHRDYRRISSRLSSPDCANDTPSI
jgi:hypothetical protein